MLKILRIIKNALLINSKNTFKHSLTILTPTLTMEFEINDPPTDGITSLSFSPFSTASSAHPPHLLATSWDSSAYIYDCALNLTVGKFPVGAAVLDGCFSKRERGISYVVGLNRQIHRLELKSGSINNFGTHDDAIKSIVHNEPTGLLFTGSWDRTVGAWDERSAPSVSRPITSLSVPDKVYSMDICDERNLLLVATAGRHIYLYDTRSLGQPLQKRESSLKYQTRTVKFFDATSDELGRQGGFICASIEGRVAVDFIDPSPEVQQSRYAFKCHRQAQASDQGNMEIVYPVNAVACYPQTDKSSCFFTGGSDGIINSWDRLLRKRIRQFPKYQTGISALAIDPQGSFLAIASSYSFDEGEKDHPPESIFIRKLDDSDIKSKSKC